MAEEKIEYDDQVVKDWLKDLVARINIINERIEHLKKVISDYLEAGSNIALASIKANLKSV